MVDQTTGLRKQVELLKRLKAWWFTIEQGKLCVSVRYGPDVIELAKGKYSIEVADEQALETVKRAVEVGELDTQINAASEQARRVLERSVA